MRKKIFILILLIISMLTGFIFGKCVKEKKHKIVINEIVTSSTEDFYLEPNEIAIILSDESYIIYNKVTNKTYHYKE